MLNKVTLIGNVGKDPETRYSKSGDPICNFSLATSEKWKDKNTGEAKQVTEWHRLVAFGSAAKLISGYVKKGYKLYIEGKLKTRKWTDNNGQERYSTEVVLSGFDYRIHFLGDQQAKSEKPAQAANNPVTEQQATPAANQFDDDIPY